MFGQGLVKGLSITIKRFFQKKITEKYPEVKPKLPARSHGSFDFCAEKCIACNLCADACPNSVIKVDYFKNEQGKRVLENYRMNICYCLFCGLCIEACPTKALNSKPDFELAGFSKDDVVASWEGIARRNEGETAEDAVNKTGSGQQEV